MFYTLVVVMFLGRVVLELEPTGMDPNLAAFLLGFLTIFGLILIALVAIFFGKDKVAEKATHLLGKGRKKR